MTELRILALGSRQDAKTFAKGCANLSITVVSPIHNIEPNDKMLRIFFSSHPEWIYLGGHFSNMNLFNKHRTENVKHQINIQFSDKGVEVTRKNVQDGKLIKSYKVLINGTANKFRLNENAKVIVWGGCSVMNKSNIQNLRTLFGQHLLLGTSSNTGASVLDAMFGGSKSWIKQHFFKRLEGNSIENLPLVRDSWMKTALTGWGEGSIRNSFQAVDPDGKWWYISKGKILHKKI